MAAFDDVARELDVRRDIISTFREDWARLSRPGSWHTSHEQIAIAAEYRRAKDGEPPSHELPALTLEAARRIALAPATVDREWVERLVSDGLTYGTYVEIVGVVSRMAAIDGFARAVGVGREQLPDAGPGPATGETDHKAKPSKAFVPMMRGTSIWWALTLVPEAFRGMEALHNVLYLSPEQMQSPGSPRAISRPQIELIASRTSARNECFY